jgi:hypothetical protein
MDKDVLGEHCIEKVLNDFREQLPKARDVNDLREQVERATLALMSLENERVMRAFREFVNVCHRYFSGSCQPDELRQVLDSLNELQKLVPIYALAKPH